MPKGTKTANNELLEWSLGMASKNTPKMVRLRVRQEASRCSESSDFEFPRGSKKARQMGSKSDDLEAIWLQKGAPEVFPNAQKK